MTGISLLPEPGHHEQPEVDRQAEAEGGRDHQRIDGHVGQLRKPEQHQLAWRRSRPMPRATGSSPATTPPNTRMRRIRVVGRAIVSDLTEVVVDPGVDRVGQAERAARANLDRRVVDRERRRRSPRRAGPSPRSFRRRAGGGGRTARPRCAARPTRSTNRSRAASGPPPRSAPPKALGGRPHLRVVDVARPAVTCSTRLEVPANSSSRTCWAREDSEPGSSNPPTFSWSATPAPRTAATTRNANVTPSTARGRLTTASARRLSLSPPPSIPSSLTKCPIPIEPPCVPCSGGAAAATRAAAAPACPAGRSERRGGW